MMESPGSTYFRVCWTNFRVKGFILSACTEVRPSKAGNCRRGSRWSMIALNLRSSDSTFGVEVDDCPFRKELLGISMQIIIPQKRLFVFK